MAARRPSCTPSLADPVRLRLELHGSPPLLMCCLRALLCALLLLPLVGSGSAQQTAPTTPAVRLQGLRSSNNHGSFKSAAYLPDGNLVLLFDGGDGVLLLKTDPSASTVLTQTQAGAAGDAGAFLAVDSAGDVYVAGISSSGQLAGTAGAAFPAPADSTLNSFVARFDSNLNLVFLSFLGAGRTEVTALAVTSDAVFVAGSNYNGALPTTSNALQRTAPNSGFGSGNGFVQSFTTSGSALHYSTYLNGVDGGTVPAAIVATADDKLYVAGETSAASFPVSNALQPTSFGPVSGFLSELSADGSSLVFSTFIAGDGLSSLALDAASKTLVATGNLALNQFPVAHSQAAMANVPYQSFLRLSADGQTLVDSVVLEPGSQSFVTPGPDGTAWVSGSLFVAVSAEAMNHGPGDSYLLHLSATDTIDQFLRIGGTATNNPAYAGLVSAVGSAAVRADGTALILPGTIAAHTDPSLRAGQGFDLGLNAGSSAVLPNTVLDLLPATCAEGAGCSGTGGLITQVAIGVTQPNLTLSVGDPPNLTLHNLSSIGVTDLALNSSGLATATSCTSSLAPFAQCTVDLAPAVPIALTATSSNAPTFSTTVPASSTLPQPLALDTSELDFGVVTASGSPVVRTITVSNLSATPQTFVSMADGVASTAPYTLSETTSTCAGPTGAHIVAANASCAVTVSLTASSQEMNDGPVSASWKLGDRDVLVTAVTQATALSASATEIDFGPQSPGSALHQPRFLYLSNNGTVAVPHAPLSLPSTSPFSLLDGCPASLAPASVCQITLTYNQATTPSFDSTTLALDGGLSVLLTGENLPTSLLTGAASANPLAVSPTSITFASSVPVAQPSTEVQTVQVTNPTAATVPFSAMVLGDFALQSTCGASLAPQAVCSLNLTFTPTQPGARAGVLLLTAQPGSQAITVALQGTAIPILPANNGTLYLGETVAQEPTTSWLHLQGSFPKLTATATGQDFAVALLADDGNGHGTLPSSAFAPTATAQCTGCWLAVQFLSPTAGTYSGTLQLSSADAAHPYQLALQAVADASQGLVVTPAEQTFPVTAVGSSSVPLTFVLTNLLAAAAPVTVQGISAAGDFAILHTAAATDCSTTLQPNASCSIEVQFTPTAMGVRSGTLTVSTDGGTTTVNLVGTATSATISAASTTTATQPGISVFPAQVDFGAQAIGTNTAVRQFAITNASASTQNLTLAASRNFPLAQPFPCTVLPAGSTCTVAVAFVPQQAGPLTGSLTITATPSDGSSGTQTVLYLRGYGTASGSLSVSAGSDPTAPISFGNIASGSSATQVLTVTNTGSTPHSVLRLSSTAPFHASTDCLQPLAPNATCEVTVSYVASNLLPSSASQAPRTDVGTLLLETDADGSPTTVYLTATALASSTAGDATATSLPTYTLSQSALTFAPTQSGTPALAQNIVVTNTGTVPVTFGALLATPDTQASSTCASLQPGATCTVSAAYQPANASTTASAAVLGIQSNAGTALDSITLRSVPPPAVLQLSSRTLDFGGIVLGDSTTLTATLANPSTSPLIMGSLQSAGDFSINGSACPAAGMAFVPGQSCTLTIVFTPTAPGTRTGTVTFTPADGSNPQVLQLSGTALAGHLVVQPARRDFGSVALTLSSVQTLTLVNSGSALLNGISATLNGANAADFAVLSGCSGSLAVGVSCTVQIAFTPAVLGSRTAMLTIASTDPSGPTLVPLSGVGAAPPGFTLSINGGATGSANINSGQSATFPLTLTPQGGFTGVVSLQCIAIAPAPNAGCTLANAQLALGGSAISSSACVSTLSGVAGAFLAPLSMLALLPFQRSNRKPRAKLVRWITAGLLGAALLGANGCGGGPGSTGNPYTPPGSYQYLVTATSAASPSLSSTVTLSVTVH